LYVFSVMLLTFVLLFSFSRFYRYYSVYHATPKGTDVPLRKILQKETLDQSFDNLVDNSQFNFAWFPTLFESRPTPSFFRVEKLLISRRAIKVLQELADMPKSKRQEKCRELYERAFKSINNYSNGPQSVFRSDGCYVQYQVALAVFATAESGDIKQLCKEYDELQSLQKMRKDNLTSFIEYLKNQKQDPSLMVRAKFLERFYLPGGNFWLTTLMLAAERNGNQLLLQRIHQKHKTELDRFGKLDSWDVPVVHWNAEIDWCDRQGSFSGKKSFSYKISHLFQKLGFMSPDKWPELDTRWGVTVYKVFRSGDDSGNQKLAAEICKTMEDETP